MFWIRAFGKGPIALNAFGAIKDIDVDGSFIIDTGHIVAFESTLDFNQAGGIVVLDVLLERGPGLPVRGQGQALHPDPQPAEFGQLVGHACRRATVKEGGRPCHTKSRALPTSR